MRDYRLHIALLATLATAACGSSSQVPVARSVGVFTRRASFELVERRQTDHGIAYVFESEADPGTRIVAARLGVAAPRCRGTALLLAVDAVAHAPGAAVDIGGQHVIDATVPGGAAPPVAIDLEIRHGGATTCVRVPVDGPDARWRRPHLANARFASADLAVPTRTVGWNDVQLRLLFGVGRYQGRIGAEISGAFLIAGCSRAGCPPPPNHLSGGGGVGEGLQLGGGVEAYPLDLGFTTLGFGAREITQVLYTDQQATQPWLWMNGLEGALHVSFWRDWTNARRRRIEGRLPSRMATIDIPVGVWTTGYHGKPSTALVVGLGVSLHRWSWDD